MSDRHHFDAGADGTAKWLMSRQQRYPGRAPEPPPPSCRECDREIHPDDYDDPMPDLCRDCRDPQDEGDPEDPPPVPGEDPGWRARRGGRLRAIDDHLRTRADRRRVQAEYAARRPRRR